jgi:hypothetical protein
METRTTLSGQVSRRSAFSHVRPAEPPWHGGATAGGKADYVAPAQVGLVRLEPAVWRGHSPAVEPDAITPASLNVRLRDRKMTQWTLGYAAAACLIIQVVASLGPIWGWSITLQRVISLGLVLGLPHAIVVAWYHGEKGRQRLCSMELILIAILTLLAGVVLWLRCAEWLAPGVRS